MESKKKSTTPYYRYQEREEVLPVSNSMELMLALKSKQKVATKNEVPSLREYTNYTRAAVWLPAVPSTTSGSTWRLTRAQFNNALSFWKGATYVRENRTYTRGA